MEIQELIRCTIMRGGTSKGIFFLKNDLPDEQKLRDKIIQRIFGSPDIREVRLLLLDLQLEKIVI